MAVDIPILSFLVIDDDEFMLKVVTANLNRLGIKNVTLCTEGADALSKIENGNVYDVVMIDLNMPIMDGVEVLRNLAQRNFPSAILLFSGEDSRILKTAQTLAKEHGLNILGSLSKPLVLTELVEKLEDYRSVASSPNVDLDSLDVSEEELKFAISNRQIVPFFQPQVSSSDKTLVSAEVLSRWNHPVYGLLPPLVFISKAEEFGLINDLTWSIIEQSISCFGRWRQEIPYLSMGVNLSANTLSVVDLPEKLAFLANSNSVPCSAICLEITESRLMQNLSKSLDVLARLRLKQFGLSIDDFGTGYSSLSQLNDIPFTELKVDRAFVHGAASDSSAKAILESSTVLGKKLGMNVVAEGVENQDDWDQVAALGCDLIQGYFVAKPMSSIDFERTTLTGNWK